MVMDGKNTTSGPAAATTIVSGRDACRCSCCRKELEEQLVGWRRVLRGLYLAIFLVGFVVGFYFTFMSIPNLSIHRVYLNDHAGQQRDYASRYLYSEFVSYGINVDLEMQKNEATMRSLYNQFGLRIVAGESDPSTEQEDHEKRILTCPCTRTTLTWTEYTDFYFLTYSSPDEKPYVKYVFPSEMDGKLGAVEIDNVASGIDPRYVIRSPGVLKSYQDFCNLLNNVPADLLVVQSQFQDCRDLVSPLLSSSDSSLDDDNGDDDDLALQSPWEDSRASFFESPVLLHQKLFYSRTLDLLRSYIREKHTLMQSSHETMRATGENLTNREMFLTALTDIWVHVLDSFAGNSSCSDTDFFMAAATRTCKEFAQQQLSYYPYHFTVMLDQGQTFLGMSMNWTQYHNSCRPIYCDVMDSAGKLGRACTAFASLGGFGTCILLLVHLVIWPLSDTALIYFCSRRYHNHNHHIKHNHHNHRSNEPWPPN